VLSASCVHRSPKSDRLLGSGLTPGTCRCGHRGVRRGRLRPPDRAALRRIGSLSAGRTSRRSRWAALERGAEPALPASFRAGVTRAGYSAPRRVLRSHGGRDPHLRLAQPRRIADPALPPNSQGSRADLHHSQLLKERYVAGPWSARSQIAARRHRQSAAPSPSRSESASTQTERRVIRAVVALRALVNQRGTVT
jgi:hypothetical protein